MVRGKLLQDKRRAFERADRDRDAMPTAATATLNWDPRSRAGTNRFLSGAPRVFAGPAASRPAVPTASPADGTTRPSPTRAWGTRESAHGAVGEARAGPSRVLGRGSSEGPLTVLCADSHLYGLDWASASNDRSER
jgi:hypothetical protein